MNELQIHIGDKAEDFGARFVGAWHRVQDGKKVNERHLSFDSFTSLARMLTPKRVEALTAASLIDRDDDGTELI